MSRHHITPPAIYTPPPPKPKETRRRRGVGYAQGTGTASEAEETEESSRVSHSSPQHGAPAAPQHQVPVEAAERRPHSPTGKLSEGMLEAQEKAER